MCSNMGQAPGTFELLLTGDSVGYKNTVKKECLLSGSDEAVLAALPSGPGQHPSGQAGAGPPGPAAAGDDARQDAGFARREVPADQGDRSGARHGGWSPGCR